MNALRQNFLDALKATGKQVIAKSAVAPPIVAIKDGAGNVVGFGPVEMISPAESQTLIAAADANSCFEGSAAYPFTPNRLNSRQPVQKSADPNDKNSCLDSTFPRHVVQKSAASGTELMNRVTGTNAKDTGTKAKQGRPKTSAKGTPLDNFDPQNPATTLEESDGKLVAGSVLQIVFPDNSIKFVVLLDAVGFDVLLEE